MIIREWRGRASRERAAAYPEHFRRAVLPELLGIQGFVGATLCRREKAGGIEYVVLTRWQSIEAIRAFAGAELDKAVVEPGGVVALTDFDDRVQHYEVVEDETAYGHLR